VREPWQPGDPYVLLKRACHLPRRGIRPTGQILLLSARTHSTRRPPLKERAA